MDYDKLSSIAFNGSKIQHLLEQYENGEFPLFLSLSRDKDLTISIHYESTWSKIIQALKDELVLYDQEIKNL